MLRYKKHDLLEIVIEAIKDSGWNLLFVSRFEKHPFLVRIFKEEKSYLLRIYIWNLTHGGGTKRPADEYRIQITGIDHFERNKGEKTLILGWWDDAQVFAGFDYTKHSGKLGFSPSIQIRENALRKAHIHGIASHNKGNGEIAVAFRPDFFVNYVEELEEIHKFADSDVDYEILEKLFEEPEQVNDETIKKVSKFRRSQILKIKKQIRDSSFKSRVLNAYGHR
ncbi:MAG TPA: HNH endonuclease, partial [Caldithrix sp.]|nr:HNH endonuclease [Caldithrix sp.]